MKMIKMLAAAVVIVVSLGTPASAHRVDEYLQATLISVEKDHVDVFLRLTPGIAVSSIVLASIDTNADGVISQTARRVYAEHVLSDLSLTVDGKTLTSRLVSVDFPEVEEIHIAFTAALPGGDQNHSLVFENPHQSQIAAYPVNCLTPRDRNIQVIAQNRNEEQSFHQLDYVQAGERSEPLHLKWWSGVRGWNGLPGATALSLFAGFILVSRQRVTAIFRGARNALW